MLGDDVTLGLVGVGGALAPPVPMFRKTTTQKLRPLFAVIPLTFRSSDLAC